MATTKQAPQYIAFVSSYCQYSQQFLKELASKHLQNLFQLVNVDTTNNLPKFVDRVPIVYDKKTRNVIVEENIDILLAQITKKTDIMTYDGAVRDSGYFYLTDTEDVFSSHDYTAITDVDSTHIKIVDEDDMNPRGRSNGIDIEQITEQRKQDEKVFRPAHRSRV